jgi:hypothetical protein
MGKRIIPVIAVIVFLIAANAAAEVEVVKTGYGSMSVGANFQVGFNYYIGDEQLDTTAAAQAVDRPEDMEFYLKRVRLAFKGDVIDQKVKYFLQFEAKDQEGVDLADVKVGFKYIPFTTIWFGRFLPHFQHWTPQNTARLYLVDYPLAYQHFGVQRHTGLDIEFNHDYVDINLGVNNGHNFNNYTNYLEPQDRGLGTLGTQTWGDENTAKDIYFNVNGKPADGLDIFAGLWYGTPLDFFEDDEGELIAHNATLMAVNAGVGYVADYGVRLWGEFFYSQLTYDSVASNNVDIDRLDDTYELTSMSYYVRAGYSIESVSGVPLEFLVQYDWLDPDTANDMELDGHAMSEQDDLTYITAGINYYLSDWHAMLYLNYIYKQEQWEDVLNKAGDDTQTGIANDELKFVAQIAF